jgi:hypothetical protein
MPRKVRGVFEKVKGSGVWWIRYHDADHQEHREKVGSWAAAADAYAARKHEIRQGTYRGTHSEE